MAEQGIKVFCKGRSQRIRVLLCLLLSIVLVLSLIPLFPGHAAAEGANNLELKQSDAELEALLTVDDYAEGEVIVIVDDAKENALRNNRNGDALNTLSTDLLSSSERLLDTTTAVYLESQGLDTSSSNQDNEQLQLLDAATDDEVSIRYLAETGLSTRELLYILRDDPRVLYVEPNYVYDVGEPGVSPAAFTDEEPLPVGDMNDLTAYQWGNSNTNATATVMGKEIGFDINPPEWDLYRTLKDAENATGVVAVVDTGIDYTHPDLEGVMCSGLDELVDDGGSHGFNALGSPTDEPMDDNGHGTHCAGIIASQWNEYGTSGVASGAELVAVKVGDSRGMVYLHAVILGYWYLADLANSGISLNAVNNSWGGDSISRSMDLAVTMLGNLGVVSIFASGNEATNVDTHLADHSVLQSNPYAVVVNSFSSVGALSPFSNYGRATTDVVAPGSMILSTYPTAQATYFPEAVSSESEEHANIVYESFDSAAPAEPAVTFFMDRTSSDTIGEPREGAGNYYFDEGNTASYAISVGEMTKHTEPSADYRSFVMKVKVPSLEFENIKYFGMRLYTAAPSDTLTYADVRVVARDENGDPVGVSVLDGNFVPLNSSSWGIVSGDLLAACEENDAELVLNDSDELEFVINPIRIDDTFTSDEIFYIDTIGLGREGSAIAYQYSSGTSMAAPAVSGACAVLALQDDPTAELSYRAKARAALIKGTVRPVEDFTELCTSGGATDLAIVVANFTPVISTAEVATIEGRNVLSIGGSFFKGSPGEYGSVTVGGIPAEILQWTEKEVKVVCPGSLSTSVLEITLTASNGNTGRKTFLLTIPSPPAENATPLFEREYLVPENGDVSERDDPGGTFNAGQIVGLGGYLYLVASSALTEGEDSRTFWRLDPASGTWFSCPDLPRAISAVTVTTYDGKVFVSGYTGYEPADLAQELFSWDPVLNIWTEYDTTSILPQATVANFNGKLLFIGGRTFDDSQPAYVDSDAIVAYDPSTETVERVGSLSAPGVAPLSTAVWGSELYVANSQYRESDLVLDRLVWNGGMIIATAVTGGMPHFADGQENWIAVAASAQGIILTGSSGLEEETGGTEPFVPLANAVVFEDQDTYLSALATEGQEVVFKGIDRRVSYAQLFRVAATSHRGMLYVLGASYFDPDTFVLRATALETAAQPGDLYTITYENIEAGEAASNPLYYADTRLPLTLSAATNRATTVFAGWYDNPELSGSPLTSIPLGTTGDLRYWAKWEPAGSSGTDPLASTGDSAERTLAVFLLLAAGVLLLVGGLVARSSRQHRRG